MATNKSEGKREGRDKIPRTFGLLKWIREGLGPQVDKSEKTHHRSKAPSKGSPMRASRKS